MKSTITSPAKNLDSLGKLLTIKDKRDRLLFGCALFLGLRGTSELSKLKWKDLKNDGILRVYQPKTSKWREFIMPEQLKIMVEECYEGQPLSSYVFTGRRGQDGSRALSNKGLNDIIRRRFKEFGIEFEAGSSSHCLRKSFCASYLRANGENITALELLRQQMGHSSINITMIYAGVSLKNQAKMINNIKYG